MTILTEKARAGEAIASESAGTRSRDEITIASGSGVIEPNTVLGKITASGKYGPYDSAASNGLETAAAISVTGADATGSDQKISAVTRDAEVVSGALNWGDADAAAITAGGEALAAAGIIARASV